MSGGSRKRSNRQEPRHRHQRDVDESPLPPPPLLQADIPSDSDHGSDQSADEGPRPSADFTTESAGRVRPRRTRTLMTAQQLTVLYALLEQTRFPTTAQREEAGRQTGLSARKVQVWFQNQRQKQNEQARRLGTGNSGGNSAGSSDSAQRPPTSASISGHAGSTHPIRYPSPQPLSPGHSGRRADEIAYIDQLPVSYRATTPPSVQPTALRWYAGSSSENPMDPTRDSPDDPFIPLGLVGRLAAEDRGVLSRSPPRHHAAQYDQPFAWNQAAPPPGSGQHGIPPVIQSMDYPSSAASYRLRSLAAPPSAYLPPAHEPSDQDQLRLPPLYLDAATRGISSSPSRPGHTSGRYRSDPASTVSPAAIPPPFTLEPEPLWDYSTSSSPRTSHRTSGRMRSESMRSRSRSDPLHGMELGGLHLAEPIAPLHMAPGYVEHPYPSEPGPSRAPPPSSYRTAGETRYDPVHSRASTPVSSASRSYPRRGSR